MTESEAKMSEEKKMACYYWVKFGSFGRQLACLVKGRWTDDFVGHKWSASKKQWTGRVRVSVASIIRSLTPEELVQSQIKHAIAMLKPQLQIG